MATPKVEPLSAEALKNLTSFYTGLSVGRRADASTHDVMQLLVTIESLRSTIEAQKIYYEENLIELKQSRLAVNDLVIENAEQERKIEAQGQEIERLKASVEVSEMADMYAKGLEDTQKLATKDATLRECARTLREYERFDCSQITASSYAALAAKCEAAIGEK